MKLILNTKMLSRIKDFNPQDKISTFYNFTLSETQQLLMIISTIDYLKSQGLLNELEVEIENK